MVRIKRIGRLKPMGNYGISNSEWKKLKQGRVIIVPEDKMPLFGGEILIVPDEPKEEMQKKPRVVKPVTEEDKD